MFPAKLKRIAVENRGNVGRMNSRCCLPLAALAAFVGCAGAPPPEHYGKGWTALDTCWPSVVRKVCPDARGADVDKCMAPLFAKYDDQHDAEAQRTFLVQYGCPAWVVGGGT